MICYFFGTFNPVHLGHIEIARKAKEEFGFSKVIFVPAFIPPHKVEDLASFEDRYNMLKLALKEENVSNIESKLKIPSYTYRTIEKLFEENNNQKINFLIGYDQFFKIEQWKEPDILKEKINFFVYPRHLFNGQTVNESAFDYFIKKGYSFKIFKTDFLDISSSMIRSYVEKGQNITGLTTKEVREYIENRGLYRKLAKNQFVR